MSKKKRKDVQGKKRKKSHSVTKKPGKIHHLRAKRKEKVHHAKNRRSRKGGTRKLIRGKSRVFKRATSYQASKSLKKRVGTGIPNFDRLIGYGFEKNSTNLLVGGSGSGKTIFATQFLIEGIKKGEKCLYVTFEEKKEEFFVNMRNFGWNLEEYEKKGLFTFLEYTPMKVKTMLEEGGGAIESIILKNKIVRIVIDSITSFELLFDDELEKREAALSLFGMIKEWNATAMLTLEEEPSEQEKMSSKTLEFESDSITVLYFVREGKKPERERYLEVIKMRGTKHSNRVFPFDITKRGIYVKKGAVTHFII